MKLVETWLKVLTLSIRYDNRERSVKKEDDNLIREKKYESKKVKG